MNALLAIQTMFHVCIEDMYKRSIGGTCIGFGIISFD
jgi:hypothetical protein